jgi:sugar-specific transcriptional regulator TrmB
MRKFIQANGQIFQRLDRVEVKQIETDQKFDQVFDALESKDRIPDQGIFFEGQVFDAYNFVSDLFRKAEKSIVIVDNYVDDTVLLHLTKLKKGVQVRIMTKSISDQFRLRYKEV